MRELPVTINLTSRLLSLGCCFLSSGCSSSLKPPVLDISFPGDEGFELKETFISVTTKSEYNAFIVWRKNDAEARYRGKPGGIV